MSRVGKAHGRNRYWFNIKDNETGALKSMNLKEIKWENVKEEILLTTEVNLEAAEVSEAKLAELNNWKAHNVYEEVEDNGQQCISTRWVIIKRNIEGVPKIKSRLVARGYEEQNINIRTDSPTCNKENICLLLAIISIEHWKVRSLDFKSAFLQVG